MTVKPSFASEMVYEFVPAANKGESVPTESASAERVASFDFVYVNLLAELAVDDPDALTRKMSISPKTEVTGVTTLICVESMSVTLWAAVEPNRTPPVANRLSKPVPVMITSLPPVNTPDEGEIKEIVGGET